MLDIEVAGAVAPKAKIVVYFAPNEGNKGFVDAVSAAIHDKERRPDIISISWGNPESNVDKQLVKNFHEMFVAAAAMGITICVATGDHGTAGMAPDKWDGKIHVDHPASDDIVLSCGGTQINANGSEVVWNDGTSFDSKLQNGGGWATGGGISKLFPVPDYQKKVNKVKSLETKKTGRGVPDIAMSATNYLFRMDGVDGPMQGTSAVAPLMAGLIARLNQAKGKNVGFINPFLYSNQVTNDITVGSNEIKDSVKGYKAAKGWDPCTGLGTPDGAAMLKKL